MRYVMVLVASPVVLALVLSIAFAHHNDKPVPDAAQPAETEKRASIPSDAASIVSVVDASVEVSDLPPNGIDATKVIWRTRHEVELTLGSGVERPDHKWRHDLAGGGFVLVVYDKGRAVGIQLPSAREKWASMTESRRDTVESWFGVRHAPTIAGRSILIRDELFSVGYGLYDEKYWDAFEARVMAEVAREARRTAKRAEVLEAFKSFFTTMKVNAAVSADDTTLLFEVPEGQCDRPVLAKLRQGMKAMNLDPADGYTCMRCSTGAELCFR